jgi:hypothetical protein
MYSSGVGGAGPQSGKDKSALQSAQLFVTRSSMQSALHCDRRVSHHAGQPSGPALVPHCGDPLRCDNSA